MPKTYEITQIPHDESKGSPFRFVVWEKENVMKFPVCACYLLDGAEEIVAALRALDAIKIAQDAERAATKARLKFRSLTTEALTDGVR